MRVIELRPNSKGREVMKGVKGIVTFWILTYILVGWLGVYAFGTTPCALGKAPDGYGGELLGAFTSLNLTDFQKRDIANVLKQHQDEMRELEHRMIEARNALLDAITANDLNEGAVREAAQRASDTQEKLAVLRAKTFDEIRRRLTLEQQETLQQIKVDFASRIQGQIESRTSLIDQWIDENSKL